MNEIETIFCKLLRCHRSQLYLNPRGSLLDSKQLRELEEILKKRIQGEPLQYLIRDVEFMGLKLGVKSGVFIPRPETEVLVETVLTHAAGHTLQVTGLKILDIGTGSGNIAIALAKFLTDCRITAIDISQEALHVAKSNAAANGVKDRIDFFNIDLLDLKPEACGLRHFCFDIIVSNPPYIALSEYAHLPQDVRREPPHALLADEDGLYFYSQIERVSRIYLKPGGALFLEIGDHQGHGIKKIFSDRSFWKKVALVKDLSGMERLAIVESVSV